MAGCVPTRHLRGISHESGPRSFRSAGNGTRVLELVGELGLADEAIGTSTASAARYVYLDGKMQALPASILDLVRSPLTRKLPLQIASGIIMPPACASDMSIHDFMRLQLGRDAAETLAAAMVNGIFAGDARRLSVKSCLPAIADFAAGGSLGRGMLRAAFAPGKKARLDGRLGNLQNSSSISFRGHGNAGACSRNAPRGRCARPLCERCRRKANFAPFER